MKNIKAKELLDKYAKGICTDEELAMLHAWYLDQHKPTGELEAEEVEKAKNNIWLRLPVHKATPSKTVKFVSSRLIKGITVAAVLLLCFSIGYYFVSTKTQTIKNKMANNDAILPGGNKASLTLADGTTIDLSDVSNGLLHNSPTGSIVKTEAGKIVHNANQTTDVVSWNLLSVPAGGFYSITLSDGTVAWLNAKSTLRYPTKFIGPNRIVELTGEGYFEVASKKQQPFKVISKEQTIEVMGTHFNVNAYADEENTTTSLLEGRVRITTPHTQQTLTPQHQAKVHDGAIKVTPYNAANALDWVNNDFVFHNESLGSIMRKIARWYDVEVSYPQNLSDLRFSGSISRTKNITQVLKIIELTQIVSFKVEGRRITVTT